MLLYGPGGSGKSAVLVQWLKELRRRASDIPNVIFLPISRRHELAKDVDFFPALAASLAPFLSDPVQLPDDAEQMRAFAQRALDMLAVGETPLLVIVDGLDEADGWTLGPTFFPHQRTGNALRIVISSRAEADDPSGQQLRRRLGWTTNATTLPLDALSSDAVRDLLIRASDNSLSPDALSELIMLCSGDPLVTHILAEQIKDHRLELIPSHIAEAVADPLRQVLKEWYERALSNAADATKPALHNLLAALAKAKGPLTRADLAVVMDISAGEIDEALRPLRTLIKGNARDGYGFSHQRMAETLEHLIGTENGIVERGFARLHESALSTAQLKPTDVPLYPLRHAAAHIAELARARVMKDMLCPAWLKAHQIRFGHVRGFTELTDAVADHARDGNLRATTTGKILPLSTLEFASGLWRAVATECMNLRLGRDSDGEQNSLLALEAIREKLSPASVSDGFPEPLAPTTELQKLIQLRDQLDPALAQEWETLAATAADAVAADLFTYGIWDNDEAVRLLQQARPDFDIAAHVKSLRDPTEQLAGLRYLIAFNRAHDRSETLQQIRAISRSTGSLALKAEAAVFLAGQKEMSFEEAFATLLALAQSDYEAAQSAAAMVIKLLDMQFSSPRSISELEDIADRFRMSIYDRGVEAPLLGAMLRHCARHERPRLWDQILRLDYFSDIETAIGQGPEDWSPEEINGFTQAMGGRTNAPTEADYLDPPAEGGAHPLWRRAQGVASVLTCLAQKTDGAARRTAMERTLDNLEFIPPDAWWSEPASTLDAALLLMRHDDASTDSIKLRANFLATSYESKECKPLSGGTPKGLYDLPAETAAAEIIEFINKWGEKGLEWARFELSCGATFVTHVTAALDHVRDPDLRRGMARLLLTSNRLDVSARKALARQAGLPDPLEQKRSALARRDREILCGLISAAGGSERDMTTATVRWLLDAGAEAHAALSRVPVPPGWNVPPELVSRLTSVLKYWDNTLGEAPFPASVAARLPGSQLREIVEYFFAQDGRPLAWRIIEVMQAIEDPETSSMMECAYLAEVSEWPYTFRDSHMAVVLAPNRLQIVSQPDEWLACRLKHLRSDSGTSEPDMVSQIAHDATSQSHRNVRQSYARWALERLEAISNPITRASIRHKLGDTPRRDELNACRELLSQAVAREKFDMNVVSVLRLLVETDTDGYSRRLIDKFVANTNEDNFYWVIEALGATATLDNIRATFNYALAVVSFTGSLTPPSEYFLRLPDDERNDELDAWRNVLKARGIVEDERRFMERIASAANSEFARNVLNDILDPDADQLFWRNTITALIARLSPQDALALVDMVLRVTRTYDSDDFAWALVLRLKPRDRNKMLAASLAELSPRKARQFRSSFCMTFPELLESKTIEDALQAAQNDGGLPLSWIGTTPAATSKQRDRAWGILLARVKSASFGGAIHTLIEALRLLNDIRGADQDIVDCVTTCIFALEEELAV